MQSARHLLAAARLGLSVTRVAAPPSTSASPVCQRCGRASAIPIRLFARRAQRTEEDALPNRRKAKRAAPSRAASSAAQHSGDASQAGASRADLLRLLAELPAADVPVAIAALSQRLTASRTPAAEPIQAGVEEEEEEDAERAEEDGEAEDEEDSEAEYAVLRQRLAKEGSVRTEAGEEMVSMEELERQLEQDGELDELAEEEGLTVADAEDEDDMSGEEDEAEQIIEEEEQQPGSPQRATVRTASSSSSSTANTFWVQERRDGTVSVSEWPFADADDDADLSDSYDLNMPSSAAQQAGIVGQAIGGEKLRRADVLQMREKDLHEHFTKGGGRGGQKVNKTSNCVHLHHLPTGTIVKCHATRSLADNRRIARNIMQGRLEELMLGPASKNAQRAAKIRKQKAKTRRRAAIKYGETDEVEGSTTAADGRMDGQRASNTGGENK